MARATFKQLVHGREATDLHVSAMHRGGRLRHSNECRRLSGEKRLVADPDQLPKTVPFSEVHTVARAKSFAHVYGVLSPMPGKMVAPVNVGSQDNGDGAPPKVFKRRGPCPLSTGIDNVVLVNQIATSRDVADYTEVPDAGAAMCKTAGSAPKFSKNHKRDRGDGICRDLLFAADVGTEVGVALEHLPENIPATPHPVDIDVDVRTCVSALLLPLPSIPLTEPSSGLLSPSHPLMTATTRGIMTLEPGSLDLAVTSSKQPALGNGSVSVSAATGDDQQDALARILGQLNPETLAKWERFVQKNLEVRFNYSTVANFGTIELCLICAFTLICSRRLRQSARVAVRENL
jgi:hypothetical protein